MNLNPILQDSNTPLFDRAQQRFLSVPNEAEVTSRISDNSREIRARVWLCISFFRALSAARQREFLSRFEVKGSDPTIENLAKYLYEMRSKFVHEAALVLHMSDGISIGMQGGKIVVCNLSIKDTMLFFEEGLIEHFRGTET